MISEACLKMIKHHEGVRVKPYRCPALIWTVGVGHVIDQGHIRVPFEERKTLPIPAGWDRVLTMGEVDAILAKDLEGFERGVLRLAPNLAGRQGAFDACVSFSFNVGLGNFQRSTIRMKIQRGEWEEAADAFLMWTKAGGKELPGLVKRRRDERALFLSTGQPPAH
jgi:lysozyme